MNADNVAPAASRHLGTEPRRSLEAAQWRQLAWITAGAIAIFVTLRQLPIGTNLSHMDFRVEAQGASAIEFCDPSNPQFIPVVAVRSPVTMTIATTEAARAGSEVRASVSLRTSSGKAIAPEDLLVTHTRRLHLLIVDPSLSDYQHVHPEPGSAPGEWLYSFTPRHAGVYRVFGDFTPAATGRGLYASADLEVAAAGGASRPDSAEASSAPGLLPATNVEADTMPAARIERDGVRYTLTTAQRPLRAGEPVDLRFAMTRLDGGDVPLEPVMGAFAHLVAFDRDRSGFAHLHPAEADVLKKPDARHPVLNFKLTIPSAGNYVVWAQVNLGGREEFVPFALEVL